MRNRLATMKPARVLSCFLLASVADFSAMTLGATPSASTEPSVSPAPSPPAGLGYQIEMSRLIPLRDGTTLEAWFFKPARLEGKAPTVLALTQYEIDGGHHQDFAAFVRRGYVFAQVLVRGRGRSGGSKSDNLGLQVGRDGYDVVEWIARQPWSNGQVVMYGGSYVGMTQWRTAAQAPPHLAAIAPMVPIYPGWDVPNTNGTPQAWTSIILGVTAGRQDNANFIANGAYWQGKLLEQYARYRPFSELQEALGIAPDDWAMEDEHGRPTSFMQAWLDHVGDEAFNLAAAPKPADYARMKVPVLTATGYFDDDQPGALRYHREHLANATRADAANHFLVMGPWDHGGTGHPTRQIEGLTIPEAAVLDMTALQADWNDWMLGRGPRPMLLKDRVTYFMLGAEEWRHAPSLEAASSGKTAEFFLSAPQGTPPDVFHSGSLLPECPKAEPFAVVVSDPHELPELDVAKYAEDENLLSQFRGFQKRALVFHSEPLAHDLEVAGQMRLKLLVQADAPDFDLWAQVLLVLPDGSAVRLGEDIRRARFRNGPFHQELLAPEQIVELPFEFWWTARRLPAGARLRLVVAPLNSPNYQKNYNTGGCVGYEDIADARVAHIKIFHDAAHASLLTLPLAAPSRVAEK